MDEYLKSTFSMGTPRYTAVQPCSAPASYNLPPGYTLPPPPPGPPPIHLENRPQEAPQIQDPRFQGSMHPSYQVESPYVYRPPPQHPDRVPVDGFKFAPPPAQATQTQPRRPSAFGGLMKDVMSAGRNAIDSFKQDSGAQGWNQGWKNAAQAVQGVDINRPPPLPMRPNTLQTEIPLQSFHFKAPVFQEQTVVRQELGQEEVDPYATQREVAVSPVKLTAPKPEIKRKAIRPLGDQFKSIGTSAVNFVKSEKGASLLSGAATALNFIASAADPDDPQTAGLTLLNTAVQSQVQRSKAKQVDAAEAQAVEVSTTSETTQGSREVEITPENSNPLANLPPEQLMLIIVMAARLQQQVAIEQAQATDPGDPEVPDLSTLDVDDPPEASTGDFQATTRDPTASILAPILVPTIAPAIVPAPAPVVKDEDETAAVNGPSYLQKAGDVGKAYMNIAIKANSNPLGTSMKMWSEVGRQVNKYRAKQASGAAEPRTVGEKASAFGTALMKSIERVGAPGQGQDNSLAGLVQRYQESEVAAQQRLQKIEATEAAFNSMFPSQPEVTSSAAAANSNSGNNYDGPASPPAVSAAAPVTTTRMGSLESALAGNYRYLRTGNGWNENNAYALGTNGRFSFSIGSSVIPVSLDHRVSAYAYDECNPTGTWRAQGDVNNGTLILNHDDGSVEHRSYQRASDGKFYVNGLRWFSV